MWIVGSEGRGIGLRARNLGLGFILRAVVVAAGPAVLGSGRGLALGVDETGGTKMNPWPASRMCVAAWPTREGTEWRRECEKLDPPCSRQMSSRQMACVDRCSSGE